MTEYRLRLQLDQYWPQALFQARRILCDLREEYPMYGASSFQQLEDMLKEFEIEPAPQSEDDTLRILSRLGDMLCEAGRIRLELGGVMNQ